MTIQEASETVRGSDYYHEALTMALGILAERLCVLPAADRDDLYALLRELPNAESSEERESFLVTMREILAPSPLRMQRMDQTGDFRPGLRLRQWIDEVGAKIKSLREQAGLSQVELAEKSGLPKNHVSRIEGGTHSPTRRTLEKLAGALDVPLSAIDPAAG